MTRVALTGAGGAIGIHMLAHIMHNTDWEIVCTDSFKHKGYFDRLAEAVKDHPEWRERIQVITHDLNAPFTEREVKKIGKIDYIINLASISDVQASIDDPVPTIRNNTELMLNMLELARDLWGLRNGNVLPPTGAVFLQFSTDEVYGPAPKDSHGHEEWSAIVPSNPYSASKAAQEAIAIAWWRSYGVPVVITNTMNNFGETQSSSKYPAMIQNRIKNGEAISVHVSHDGQIGTRYYIHSRNVADAALFILERMPTLHGSGKIDRPDRYNIVGDRQVDNLELVKIIARLMGKEAKTELVNFHGTNPGHDLHYGLNGKKLADLGWEPPLTFEESLNNTIKWQEEHPEWI